VVQLSLDLGGFPVQLADTAGLRDSTDEVEIEGVQRARTLALHSDLVVLVAEASQALAAGVAGLPAFFEKYLSTCQVNLKWQDCLVVLNKADLMENDNEV
jgi:tRNA U34 5-carboxymethylaminomethyl modifying GTPase MnmE/TrmE